MINPKSILEITEKVLTAIAWVFTVISGVSLLVLVSTFGWLVFGRYVLNDTPTFVEQLALVLMLVITFLSAAVGVREGTHLAVQTLPMLSPPPIRKSLRVVAHIAVGGFGVVMVIESVKLIVFGWNSTLLMLGLPEGTRGIPVAICGALIVVFSISNLLHLFLKSNVVAGSADISPEGIEDTDD